MTEQLTPLHQTHVNLHARMAPFGGWLMPIQYEGILAEHQHTRVNSSIFDISHMGEFELRGPTAGSDLERLLTQRIDTLNIGQCRYGFLLQDDGGVLDDLTCYRLDENRYWLVVNAATCEGDADWIRSRLSPDTTFEDLSPATAKLDVQGPTSRRDMEEALGVSLPDLGYFRSTAIDLLGIPCLLSRTGYTGEWGYELYLPWDEAGRFWDALTAPGRIKPAGLGARDTLRLEVGYPLYGHELSRDRTPVSTSRGMFIDMEKDFIGKAAVERELKEGAGRYVVGLLLDSKRAARADAAVFDGDREIGAVTSGSLGPSLDRAIALALVDDGYTSPGTEVEIDLRGKRLPATVVELPFYREGTARKKPA